MKPSIGRIVHYKLSTLDAEEIDRIIPPIGGGAGPSDRDRNPVEPGEVYPAVIVRVFDSGDVPSCNLQVLLDGDCQYWATSRTEGDDEPGQWFWPPRV